MVAEPRDPKPVLDAAEAVVKQFESLARHDPEVFASFNFDDVEVLAELAHATGERSTAARIVHAWASHDQDWRHDRPEQSVTSWFDLAPEIFDDRSAEGLAAYRETGLYPIAVDSVSDYDPLIVRKIDRLVRSTHQLLPEPFTLHADLGGDGTPQILWADENTTSPDDPHASAGMDPEADPPTWIYSSSDGNRYVTSNLTVDASPKECAAWLIATTSPTQSEQTGSRSRMRERRNVGLNSTERATAREI